MLRTELVASLHKAEGIRNEGTCHWVAEQAPAAEGTSTREGTPSYILVCDERTLLGSLTGKRA
ncbi:MAG: hypothetical protein LC792_13175, partial [Actinobacteria bacterium]|nr:hypothetical protein [Actinomycetota bacterium]